MKRKTIVLLSSVLAGALLVGGTFAAYAVTDNADPFGINGSPGTAHDDETHYVVLSWNQEKTTHEPVINNLVIGEHRRAAVVSLAADPAHDGVFSIELTDTTEEKPSGKAALFDYIHVDMIAGALDEYPEEPTIYADINPTTEAVEGVKSLVRTIHGTPGGEDFTIFVSIDSLAIPVFEDMEEDQFHLEIDWSPKAGEEDTGNLVYFAKPGDWDSLYAYAFDETGAGFNAWPGSPMTLDTATGLYALSIPLGYTSGLVFNDNTGGHQTDDISWTGYNEASAPYWNGSAWAALPSGGQDEPEEIPTNVLWGSPAQGGDFTQLAGLVDNPEKPELEFVAEDVVLAVGQEFKIHLGEEEWYGYDQLKDGTTQNPNAKGNFTKNEEEGPGYNNIQVAVAGTYSFYIEKSGGLTWVVLEGETPTPTPEPQPQPQDTVTLNVNLGDYANDDAVCFINYWGPNELAGSVKVVNGKATISAAATGLIVVRCHAEAESVIWSGEGANVYNQTYDITDVQDNSAKTLTFGSWGGQGQKDTFTWVA